MSPVDELWSISLYSVMVRIHRYEKLMGVWLERKSAEDSMDSIRRMCRLAVSVREYVVFAEAGPIDQVTICEDSASLALQSITLDKEPMPLGDGLICRHIAVGEIFDRDYLELMCTLMHQENLLNE